MEATTSEPLLFNTAVSVFAFPVLNVIITVTCESKVVWGVLVFVTEFPETE
jgi:hypothetical protein